MKRNLRKAMKAMKAMNHKQLPRKGERGSALVYILIAIALLAALTLSFMEPSSQQTSGQNTFRAVSEMNSQVDFIRSAIQECVLMHPRGDNGAISEGAQWNQPYPLMPNDDYFDDQCGSGETALNDNVAGLRCPGHPGDDPCHQPIFGGASGKFLPPPPSLFEAWRYYAGGDGIFLWIETAFSDPYIDDVLERVDESYSLCEADVIDATGGAFVMTSDMGTDVQCPAGSRCFRLWMRSRGSAVYQPGSPEDGAGC